MQYLVYDSNYSLGGAAPPTPELMVEMGAFVEEAIQAGVQAI